MSMQSPLQRQLLGGIQPIFVWMQRRLQRWVTGFMWLIISLVLGLTGVIAVLFSLFFELAKMPEIAAPSLITGLVAGLLAVVVLLEGKRLWR